MVIITDAIREIHKSKKRFLSLLILVMLATAFLSGLRTTAPDMKKTAQKYYKQQHLMDFRLISTLGWEKEDVDYFKKAKGVSTAEGLKSVDKKMENITVSIRSIPESINKLYLQEGRLPNKIGECAIDKNLLDYMNVKIGDTLFLKKEEDTILKDEEFVIVGICSDSMYISSDRGSSNVGTGTIAAFIHVLEDEFDTEYYTDIFLTLSKTKEMDAYTDEYDDCIDDSRTFFEIAAKEIVEKKYDKILSEYNKSESEFNKAVKEYEENMKNMALLQQVQGVDYGSTEIEVPDFDGKRKELELAKEKIENMKRDAYVLDRNTLEGYVSYSQDADKMADLAKVFPVIFYLVSALSCLTTMTRMIEEHREEIGTLKALGYGNVAISVKYIGYAFLASFLGGTIGIVWGCIAVPLLAFTAWQGQYTLIDLSYDILPLSYILPVAIAVFLVTSTAYLSCKTELSSRPAQLMRPRTPKAGRRIFLENIHFFWDRVKFSTKVSCRNLFRYKLRFWMTVLGICGCTALLVVGVGLYDAIYAILDKQFAEVSVYDASLSLKEGFSFDERNLIQKEIEKSKIVEDSISIYKENVDCSNNIKKYGKETTRTVQNINLVGINESDSFRNYVKLKNRKSGEELSLFSDETKKGKSERLIVIITEKMSDTLGLKIGDVFTVKRKNNPSIGFEVGAITENYVNNYIYADYKKLSKVIDVNGTNEFWIKYKKETRKDEVDELSTKLVGMDSAGTYTRIASTVEKFEKSLSAVNAAVYIIIVAAAALAFVVLYNLTNINVTERIRELATLKVLGFTDFETTNYIYRENTVMTFFGILLGLISGKYLVIWLMMTVENDYMMFGRDVSIRSYLVSALLTLAFSLLVNIAAHFSIRNIDMVESLKSVD